MKRSYWIILLVAIGLLTMLMAMSSVAHAAPLRGAIFTTTDNGSIVNENVHYDAKIDVYLDGGPPPNAPQTAAGLPDGDYVFQVTDPSGKVLLSEDAAQWRVVRVEDGVIVALRDWLFSTIFVDHVADDAGHKEGKSLARHDTNYDVDHGPPAIVVQLMPFYNTPNPGGVYKAWITPVATYVAKGGNLAATPTTLKYRGKVIGYKPDPSFGPPRDQVKTDNFKVKEFFPPEIKVRKFHDKDADGVWDAGEPEIGVDEFMDAGGNIVPEPAGGGWPFSVLDPTGVTNYYFTPKTIVDDAGNYYVTEGMFDHWLQTAAYLDGVRLLPTSQTVTVTVAGLSGEKHEVIFGNVHLGKIKVHKYHDRNQDREMSAGEEPLLGWQFTLYEADGTTMVTTDAYGNPITNPKTTDASGFVEWGDLLPGSYVVKETPQAHWLSTTGGLEQTVNLAACSTETLHFGNVHLGKIKVHKYHDRNQDGEMSAGEEPLLGWQFTLYEADGITMVTTDAYGNPITNPKTTDASGFVEWEDLLPGSYVVKETPQAHWLSTTGGLEQTVSFESCTDETVAHFGNVHLGNIKARKFYDSNRNGRQDIGEQWLSDWQFTLYEADGTTMVTTDAYGNAITNPKTTDANGEVVWEDLRPGTYVVMETLKSGWVITTDLSQTATFESCTAETIVDFGNFRAKGLTPGFWKNWRNHFTDSQFESLLTGTIAPTILQADAIFEQWYASPDNELTILRAFLLANQLTLNLSTAWPDNPYGWLAPYVSIEGIGTLQSVIEDALAILADPSAYTRSEILAVKNKLDAFANLY